MIHMRLNKRVCWTYLLDSNTYWSSYLWLQSWNSNAFSYYCANTLHFTGTADMQNL